MKHKNIAALLSAICGGFATMSLTTSPQTTLVQAAAAICVAGAIYLGICAIMWPRD